MTAASSESGAASSLPATPRPSSRRSDLAAAERRRAPAPAGLLEQLLSRRIVFVAGKGGTGKTTVTAALALLAARAGRNVLCVEVEPKGDLAVALGSQGATFQPRLAQPNVHVLALRPEESFQEYLRTFFKVPRFARVTPLAKVFDFIATSVPGPRDMLVVGKIAFEERRRDSDGAPVWDIVIVDGSASGHIASQLNAARAMMKLVRGGMISSQVEWIDRILSDERRTCAVLTALPEEMPVVETVELFGELVEQNNVRVAACVLNRVVPEPLPPPLKRALAALTAARAAVAERLPAIAEVGADLELVERLHASGLGYDRQLRAAIDVPVVEVALVAARNGLATSRAVASVIAEAAS
ncbi:MAG: ArsA-related P-loop ATPase [Candidatus Dormibacteria bacterium]